MSKKKRDGQTNTSVKPPKKKKGSGLLGRIIRRFFLLLFTVIILVVAGLALAMNLVFNGPSPAARDMLTMTLLEPSATKWIPGLFMDKALVEQIRNSGKEEQLADDTTDTSKVVIDRVGGLAAASDEWANFPDGIRIETYKGKSFDSYIMLIRDPSRVYLGLSTYNGFSTSIPGKRLNIAIEDEGAVAAINAGAFNDDGTAGSQVGSVPAGLTISGGKVVSNVYKGLVPDQGFCGFNTDDILVVAKTMTPEQAQELNIRDGCEFGPVLIINGEVNQAVYSGNSGMNPRTCVGQRADGTVIFICADGRQVGSMGATYKDMIDLMVEYGAVNACNMDGGSSTVMYYRDVHGLYGEAGKVQMINSYSVLQSEPRRMPDFWMVRPQS